jgi:hypothetical protein
MRRFVIGALLMLFFATLMSVGQSQNIQSSYADITITGNWQSAKQFVAGNAAQDLYYDSGSGALLLISQQAGLLKVGDIAKFFSRAKTSSKDAAAVLSDTEFRLPLAYTDRASKDLAKGSKPPRMWDLKEGEGNPMWFYASQLFDEYHVHGAGGLSEITEVFVPVTVVVAEQRAIPGGDVLLFEVETDKAATDAALKRFHMPASFKDQHVRYGWVQFSPGGIASGNTVLSVAFAVPANSNLTIEEVAKQVSAAKVKSL